jgi:hypothetical protein
MSRLGRILTKPIGWPTYVFFGLASMWLLWLGLYPVMYYLNYVFLLFDLWVAVVAWLILRTIIARVLRRRFPEEFAERREKRLRSWYLLLMILITTALLFYEVPMRLGFMTAKHKLSAMLSNLEEGEAARIEADFRAGIYTISREYTYREDWYYPDLVVFVLADDPGAAFVYSSSGIENVPTTGLKGHLTGNWYWRKDD